MTKTKTPYTSDCATGTSLPWLVLFSLLGFGTFMCVAAVVSLTFGPGPAFVAVLIAAGICLLLLLGLAFAVAVFTLCRRRHLCLPSPKVSGKDCPPAKPMPDRDPKDPCASSMPAAGEYTGNLVASHLDKALRTLESNINASQRKESSLQTAMKSLDEEQLSRATKLLDRYRRQREAWTQQSHQIETAIGLDLLQSTVEEE